MELSMNIGHFKKRRNGCCPRSMQECAEITKRAGFNFVDFSGTDYLENDNWRERTEEIRNIFEKVGLTVNQTHAPYVFEKYNDDDYREYMMRAFEINSLVGSDYIVVHADKYIPDTLGYNPKRALTEIYDFYAPYVEYAKKKGFSVAIENLFEPVRDGVRTRYTSTIEEQLEIIEKFNDPSVVACWDFGHGKISNPEDPIAAMARLGSLVKCLHVHDNIRHFESDCHIPVYFGDTDWERAVKYLKSSDYEGKFTYEVGYATMPDSCVDDYAKFLYKLAKTLIEEK